PGRSCPAARRPPLSTWLVEGRLGRVEIGGELVVNGDGEDAPDGLGVHVDATRRRFVRRSEARDRTATDRDRERLAALGFAQDSGDVVSQLALGNGPIRHLLRTVAVDLSPRETDRAKARPWWARCRRAVAHALTKGTLAQARISKLGPVASASAGLVASPQD